MHSSSFDTDIKQKDGGEVLVGVAALVTEGRIPEKLSLKSKGFYEGPHCKLTSKPAEEHKCDLNDSLCCRFDSIREEILKFWHKNIPICVEVMLTCHCKDDSDSFDSDTTGLLLEQWFINIQRRRSMEIPSCSLFQLLNAIRSQLYFSQITAWLTTQDEKSCFKITKDNLQYHVVLPGETVEGSEFSANAIKHDFPPTDVGNGFLLNVSLLSKPRMSSVPVVTCPKCENHTKDKKCFGAPLTEQPKSTGDRYPLFDDRMHSSCNLMGKHRCEDAEDFRGFRDFDISDSKQKKNTNLKNFKTSLCPPSCKKNKSLNSEPSTSTDSSRSKQNNVGKVNFYSVNPFDIQSKYMLYPHDEAADTTTKGSSDYLKVQKDRNESFAGYFNTSLIKSDDGQSSHKDDLSKPLSKGQLLLDAIERTARRCTNKNFNLSDKNCDGSCEGQKEGCKGQSGSSNNAVARCDMSPSDILSISNKSCDSPNIPLEINDCGNILPKRKKVKAVQKITFEKIGVNNDALSEDDEFDYKISAVYDKKCNNKVDVPSASEQAKFRKYLDSAASMVFHSQTGLPLTSSPAPVRRGKSCFDFDSTINSVSAIKSALYSSSFSTDEESESEGSSSVSPCSPDTLVVPKREPPPTKYRRKGHAANLLGSFEESVLNGRLEPVSTVQGFKAELGASGSFVPKHVVCPVTVFFYTLGDIDKMSSPYLGHINLGRKGYNVPRSGTLQVTLFNPLGTVVKMFVIMYDLSDMPPNSQTFIRQRTLYMPTDSKEKDLELSPKWLRFLIHLRFMSSKSGKVYLHSDIRMIIIRKSDMDTATAHGIDMGYELRSFTHMPSNPRFSPRK